VVPTPSSGESRGSARRFGTGRAVRQEGENQRANTGPPQHGSLNHIAPPNVDASLPVNLETARTFEVVLRQLVIEVANTPRRP